MLQIVTSLTSSRDRTEAALVYLTSAVAKRGISYSTVDLSGTIGYHSPPPQLVQSCSDSGWLNPSSITEADWMDAYLPKIEGPGPVLFSAQFSPDVVFHARQSVRCKRRYPHIVTAIGGCALTGLSAEQLEFTSRFFDLVFVGYEVDKALDWLMGQKEGSSARRPVLFSDGPPDIEPDYSLVELRSGVTVYSGHGCYYARCRFCDYPSRSNRHVFYRSPQKVATDLRQVADLNPRVSDITLTQDAYSEKQLRETAAAVAMEGPEVPYHVMFRAEPWVNRDLAKTLAASGCTEVFIGAEALDDRILNVLGKGVTTNHIVKALRALSGYVHVTVGLVLFVPGVEERWLHSQEKTLASVIDIVDEIEPEILTVVNGSEFANSARKYGIRLYADDHWVNDSWCFGLSQDIPWTFENSDSLGLWLEHCDKLKDLCVGRSRGEYWERINRVRERIMK
jgi:hypothetical protein